MSDPRRTGDSSDDLAWRNDDWSDSTTVEFPEYPDPAYASQLPTYGYPPPTAQSPVGRQRPWVTGPLPGQPGHGGVPEPPEPPGPPQIPRWLFFLAGAAVLLVLGLVAALLIVDQSATRTATVPSAPPVAPLPSAPPTAEEPGATSPSTPSTPGSPTSPAPSTTTPPTSESPQPTIAPPPDESTGPGTPQTVVYSVTGNGRAISIAYIDTGGVLQTEFNVVLPWSKQVSLSPPASKVASVTVVNIGERVTCSVSVDGASMREHTGTVLTVCSAAA